MRSGAADGVGFLLFFQIMPNHMDTRAPTKACGFDISQTPLHVSHAREPRLMHAFDTRHHRTNSGSSQRRGGAPWRVVASVFIVVLVRFCASLIEVAWRTFVRGGAGPH